MDEETVVILVTALFLTVCTGIQSLFDPAELIPKSPDVSTSILLNRYDDPSLRQANAEQGNLHIQKPNFKGTTGSG